MIEKILNNALLYPLKEFSKRIALFIPKILIFFTIFIIGLIIAKIVKVFIIKFSKILNLDKFIAKSGFSDTLEKGGITETSSILLSRIIYWIILILFIMIGLTTLDINIVNNVINKFLIYIPNLITGVFIIICGYALANFFGRAALIAGVNANIKSATYIGKVVRLVIIIFALAMAMDHIGLARNIIISAFSIVFGGVILALSLAFGLAGRDLAKEFLEKKIKEDRDSDKDGISHL